MIETGINIVKKTSTANTTYSKGRPHKYIVIHYTAGVTSKAGTAANTANYFSNPKVKASADFIVDDATIVQYNPDLNNRYCWAVGGNKYKTKGGSLYGVAKQSNVISIEVCSTNKTKKVTNVNDANWYFTDAVVNKAVELTKYLMQTYNIDINHVIRHYDVTGKPCPGIIGWNADTGSEVDWNNFKARLNGTYKAEEEDIVTQEQFNQMMGVYLEQTMKEQPSSWSQESRNWAEKEGIIKGDQVGNKQYKKFCTREELVEMLYRTLNPANGK